MSSVSTDALRALARRSVDVISEHQHVGGAYPASPTFSVYGFSWFRDGAFIADAMSRAGRPDSAERFFRWCAGVVEARLDHVAALVDRAARGEAVGREEHLPTRYTLDGRETGEDWWDFQLDGYGTWIWALVEHLGRHGLTPDGELAIACRTAVTACVEYLAAFWSSPCFDWWEEHADRVHVSTLGALHAGLTAAARAGLVDERTGALATSTAERIATTIRTDGVVDGHLRKMLGDERVDASLIACLTPFAVVDPTGPVAEATYAKVVADLAPDGVHRFVGDTFFGGGRWVVLAGFVGWHEAATGRLADARRRLEWMHAQQTPDGLLPEQVTTHSFDPAFVPVWEAKWGPVATPLLWSHAMYITLADALGLVHESCH